jgi:hypothetical protein
VQPQSPGLAGRMWYGGARACLTDLDRRVR